MSSASYLESFTLRVCYYLFAASVVLSLQHLSPNQAVSTPLYMKIPSWRRCRRPKRSHTKNAINAERIDRRSVLPLQSGNLDVFRPSAVSASCNLSLNLYYSNAPLPFCRVSLLHLKPTICAAPELTHPSPLPFFEFISHLYPCPATQSEPYVIITASSSSLMRRCWLTTRHPS